MNAVLLNMVGSDHICYQQFCFKLVLTMAFFFKVEVRVWGKSCLELSSFVFVFAWKIHVGSIAEFVPRSAVRNFRIHVS